MELYDSAPLYVAFGVTEKGTLWMVKTKLRRFQGVALLWSNTMCSGGFFSFGVKDSRRFDGL